MTYSMSEKVPLVGALILKTSVFILSDFTETPPKFANIYSSFTLAIYNFFQKSDIQILKIKNEIQFSFYRSQKLDKLI